MIHIEGKTNIEKEEFDVFMYCFNQTKKVLKPNSIEIIKSFANDNSTIIDVLTRLNLKNSIKEKELYHASCKKIEIPPHVKVIYKNTFKYCDDLKEFIISEDSELETIEKDSFCNVEKKIFFHQN